MNKVLYETKNYEVIVSEIPVIAEDGNYSAEGYAVRNKETGIVELTTMVFPSAIYQAQYLSDALNDLLNNKKTDLALVEIEAEDVVPNGGDIN